MHDPVYDCENCGGKIKETEGGLCSTCKKLRDEVQDHMAERARSASFREGQKRAMDAIQICRELGAVKDSEPAGWAVTIAEREGTMVPRNQVQSVTDKQWACVRCNDFGYNADGVCPKCILGKYKSYAIQEAANRETTRREDNAWKEKLALSKWKEALIARCEADANSKWQESVFGFVAAVDQLFQWAASRPEKDAERDRICRIVKSMLMELKARK